MFSVPFQPLKAINNALAEKEPWQIVAITASSVIVVVWTHSLFNARESPLERAHKTFFRLLRKAPFMRGKIDSELNRLRNNFKRDMAARTRGVEVRIKLPDQGLSAQTVNDEVKKHLELGKFDWRSGRVSGAVYHLNSEVAAVACDAYKLTAYTNPLHSDVFPGINKLEAEIVRIAVSLFHGDEQACGAVTTGGTESILLACKAFRDLAYSKGISNPQIIMPSTAHSAFDKAAQYLQLSVKVIPVDEETMTVNVAAVRRAISRRTCLIVGSAPNFPYGTMDNIEELSALAEKYKIPLHVDACLGGWLSAFMPAAGFPIAKFDFALPGVSSISADTHKYGYAPKGSSILLFRLPEYRHHMYTVTTDWPGGVYGSPTVNGSRAGGIIASCWATMMFLGRDKYVQMTKDIITTTRYIEKRLREVKGIFIFGTPATSVVAFGSDDFDIFRVGEALHNKGWSLNALQFPSGLHLAVTAVHTQPEIADAFVNDVIENVKIAMEDVAKPATGMMAIYGVSQTIADRSIVEEITKYYIDAMYHIKTDDD